MNDAAPPVAEYRFLDWRYEPERRRLVRASGEAAETRLKPLPDRLLRRLLDAPGAVLSREQLIDEVWTRREVNDEVLSRAIAELRALLGDDARAPRFVETLSKGGYRWIAPVARIEPPTTRHDTPLERPAPASRGTDRRAFAALAGIAIVLLGVAAWLLRHDRSDGPARLAVGLLAARPLTADARLEYEARFDGAGRVVYIRAARGGSTSELVLVDPATLAERVLWQDASSLSHPAPSPNGREIAVTSETDKACGIWSVALVDLRRTRLGDCARSTEGGLEWTDGGEGLIYTAPAADAAHAPGLALLDRRRGTQRVLTTPEIAEGAHVHPRLSRDGTRLVYASQHDGEQILWQTDWPRLDRRNALLERPEPVYGHAFEPDGTGLWVAGDLTLYRALHRLRDGGEPELIGGRGAMSIDVAANGAAVWSEANFDADIWLRTGDGAAWTPIAISNRYESQPEFSPDGSRVALVSNRNGAESVFVHDRRDGHVHALALDPRLRWVRPTWSARGNALILTAYEDRHTRLYRYRLDGDVASPLPLVAPDAFLGVERADCLVFLAGHGSGRGTLMQWREGDAHAERVPGVDAIKTYRMSQDWLVWRTPDSTALRAAPWPALHAVREIASDDGGEAFALAGHTLTFSNDGALWTLELPDGEPTRIAADRMPSGNGPSLALSSDGTLAVVTQTSMSMDLMIADAPVLATALGRH
ncbi:winged helix-turn-helix domain-containing protein [Dokdonella sp.]|uniref:winged helix-turn-helix domain-containing protein n=1 Tax=Dokdonella sp. TaxID=2291710 RepID=UPI003782DD30